MQLRIQTRLLLSFTVLSTILVASSSYLYYTQSSKDLRIRMEESNRQQIYRLMEALDNIVEDMDRISAQVIYNSDFKNYLMEQGSEDASSFQSFTNRQKYEDLLASFNGPWFIATQINVMTVDGFFLTYGQNMNTAADIPEQIGKSGWLKKAFRLDGDKLLVPPHYSEWQDDHPLYFSLVRSFNFPPAFPAAAVEVQQPYTLLAQKLEVGRNEASEAKVYVINDQGEIFYPYSDQPDTSQVPRWTGETREFARADGNGTDIWSQVRSDFSGLTVLIKQPKAEVMQPIEHLRTITLILALLGEFASLVIAYLLSVSIASPIRYLQKRFERVTIDSITPLKARKLQNIREISLLYTTFEDMQTRLNHSLNEVLQSQQRENVAYLQAMYAQMNPHFLFNTLTALASHADESGFPEYAYISQQLSGMLRYSTSSLPNSVTLKQEFLYTTQYMDLMRFRYEGQFTFNVHLDPQLENEAVPKFLLQPLVENSFAHGFLKVRPPWIIEVSASMPDNASSWEIRICDNGSGFTEAAFNETRELIQELNEGRVRQLDSLSVKSFGHMGIVNTLTRCRLFWNDEVQFSLSNQPKGMEFTITIRKANEHVPTDTR